MPSVRRIGWSLSHRIVYEADLRAHTIEDRFSSCEPLASIEEGLLCCFVQKRR
jgi:hypothetical protein